MTNQSTIDKLIEMRLSCMADSFRNQLNDPEFNEVPFEDRFGMIVDIEYNNRKSNRLKRLIKKAEFDQPDASIMDVDYTSGRKLNKELITRLATCEYLNIEISLSQVQLVAEKRTWHVPLVWKHVNNILIPSMFGYLIF
jgi:hypothetical protein